MPVHVYFLGIKPNVSITGAAIGRQLTPFTHEERGEVPFQFIDIVTFRLANSTDINRSLKWHTAVLLIASNWYEAWGETMSVFCLKC